MTITRAPGRALVGGLVALLLALAACGGDDETEGGYVELLESLPNSEALREHYVLMADYERLRIEWEVERPAGDDLTFEDDLAYVRELLSSPDGTPREPYPSSQFMGLGGGADRAPEEVRSAFGFGLIEVDRWAVTQGGDRDFVMTGRFDPDSALDRLATCDECVQPAQDRYRDQLVLAWEEPAATQRARDLGLARLGRLSIGDGFVLRSDSTDGLHAMLDAQATGESLAEFEPYRLLAVEFNRLRTVEAILTGITQGAGLIQPLLRFGEEDADPQILPAFEAGALTTLQPYVAMGTGRAIEDGEPATYVVLAHEDEASAEENASRLESRFAEFLERDLFELMLHDYRVEMYESISIETDGRLLTTSLHGGGGGTFPVGRVPLFLHE